MTVSTSTQTVAGALTFETVPGLYQSASNWFAGAGDLTIDLAQVTRTDSAGLALLIEWLRCARAANRTLRFANIPAQVQTLIRINGLQDALMTGEKGK
jgi:phospholipid transport system transporter-binding protein